MEEVWPWGTHSNSSSWMSELTGACFQIDPSCQLGLLYFQSGKRRHSHYLGSGLRNLISTWNHIGVHTIHILPGTQVHLADLQTRRRKEMTWLAQSAHRAPSHYYGTPLMKLSPALNKPLTLIFTMWLCQTNCHPTHRCGPQVVQTPWTLTQWVANFNMPKKIHLNESLKLASKCVDKLYVYL